MPEPGLPCFFRRKSLDMSWRKERGPETALCDRLRNELMMPTSHAIVLMGSHDKEIGRVIGQMGKKRFRLILCCNTTSMGGDT